MKNYRNRREFLGHVGSGMLIAGAGASVAAEIGCNSAFAFADSAENGEELSFGHLDQLVDLMQQEHPDQLQQTLVSKLDKGQVDLKSLVAAAALANAETFGGQDYVGYHTEMALVPSLEMSAELPEARRALPVLKVIYRNAEQIQNVGGAQHKTLHHHAPAQVAKGDVGQQIRQAVRGRNMREAETLFASIDQVPIGDKFNAILPTIEDDINVHRFVLAHRALELVDIVGMAHAHTMLRQCVRHCVDVEQAAHKKGRRPSAIRTLLPKLIDQYKLTAGPLGTRDPGDKWVEETADAIYQSSEFEAAEIAAAALSEGISPKVVAESISLAANSLVLRQGADKWRTHGDSAGVHASDASNAWRNILPVASPLNAVGGLICSAFHIGRYESFDHDPYPTESHRLKAKPQDAKGLLGLAEECIRGNDQGVAAAAIQVYGERGYDVRPVLDLMLKYAVSEDGRLHAEKYYRTVCEEYQSMRPRFRWRQIVGLARVTASAYGYDRFDNKGHRAGGYEAACRLLNVSV